MELFQNLRDDYRATPWGRRRETPLLLLAGGLIALFVVSCISMRTRNPEGPTAPVLASSLFRQRARGPTPTQIPSRFPRQRLPVPPPPPSRNRRLGESLCSGTVANTLAGAGTSGLRRPMQVGAILLPDRDSQNAVKHVIVVQLGIPENAADALISESLAKMDWEQADDEDSPSPMHSTSLVQQQLDLIDDPYKNSNALFETLRDFGFENEDLKGLVTRFPILLRLHPKNIRAVISQLRGIGMSEIQVRRYVAKMPTILAYNAERHVLPAIEKLRKRTKLADRTLASLIALQPDLLTAMIDSLWSSERSTSLLKEAWESQKKAVRFAKKNADDDRI